MSQKRKQQYIEIIEAYGQSIERMACAHEFNSQVRPDLVQDIHLAIWQALGNFKQASALKTFVFRVIQNTIYNHIASRAKHKALDNYDVPPIDPDSCTLKSTTRLAQQEALLKAVNRLPINQRQVTLLTFEGLNYQEISDVLGLSSSNVGILLHRAKRQLKTLMREHHHDG